MDLSKLLNPKKIVIAGATEKETYGGFAVKLMEQHAADRMDKDIYLVNPGRDTVFGHKCYHSIGELPEDIDLVIIASAKKTVPDLIRQAAAKGAGASVRKECRARRGRAPARPGPRRSRRGRGRPREPRPTRGPAAPCRSGARARGRCPPAACRPPR